jgi:hypothetical protein
MGEWRNSGNGSIGAVCKVNRFTPQKCHTSDHVTVGGIGR